MSPTISAQNFNKIRNINLSLSNFSVILAIILAFCSMQPWFAWNINALSLIMITFVITRIPYIIKKRTINRKLLFPIFIFLIFGILYSRPTMTTLYDTLRIFLTIILPCVGVMLFTDDEVKKFIKWLIDIYCIILSISIPLFILYQLGFSLPNSTITHPNPFYLPFHNHYFFVTTNSFLSAIRFNSIYTEPGHLGMMCALFLYINQFTLKSWKNIVLLIALIMSLSLGGYLLAFLGFIIYKITTTNKILKLLLLLFCCIGSLFVLVLNYDYNSTNVFSVKILSRMQFDSETGLAGNNRNTDSFNEMYDRYSSSTDYYIGITTDEYRALTEGTANSSYKNFILANGIIATSLIWLFFLLYLRVYPSKVGLGFIVLLFICFLQRPYIMWAAQIYTAICIIRIYNKQKNLINAQQS